MFDEEYWKNAKDSELPVVVDCELVRRLRREGKRAEATALVNAFQKSMRKNWAEGRRINANLENSKKRVIYANMGRCPVCGDLKEVGDTKYRCKKCRHSVIRKPIKETDGRLRKNKIKLLDIEKVTEGVA